MVSLKDRNREELDTAHINIVKMVQALQPDAPAIVSLVTLKWTWLTTYIDKVALIFLLPNDVFTKGVCP